ncbi:hypothetical protein BDN70DRAFT_314937 [Pholiota conissans]|uniref:Uncharacterized protein n=1 Tax=Pholiota conissans TaxID=109636 RepID=A0A9P6CV45_9AGAR|nr:hypothetical protein BDN70DRAFT_314937 [Pholiota conissans]
MLLYNNLEETRLSEYDVYWVNFVRLFFPSFIFLIFLFLLSVFEFLIPRGTQSLTYSALSRCRNRQLTQVK